MEPLSKGFEPFFARPQAFQTVAEKRKRNGSDEVFDRFREKGTRLGMPSQKWVHFKFEEI